MNKYEAVCLWIICVFQNQIYDNMELTVSLYKIKKKKKKVWKFFLKQKKNICVLLIHFTLLQSVKYKHVFPVRYPWRTKCLRGLVITFFGAFHL